MSENCPIEVFGISEESLRDPFAASVARLVKVCGYQIETNLVLLVCGPNWVSDIQWQKLQGFLGEPVQVLVLVSEDTPHSLESYEGCVAPSFLLQSINLDIIDSDTPGSRSASPWRRSEELAWIIREKQQLATIDMRRGNGAFGRAVRMLGELKPANGGEKCEKALDLFRFARNPNEFRITALHAEKSETRAAKVREFEPMMGGIVVPEDLCLKVLLVENKPSDLATEAYEALRAVGADYYLVESRKGFDQLLKEAAGVEEPGKKTATKVKFTGNGEVTYEEEVQIPWDKIDLVLQDIMLGEGTSTPTGLHLAPYYLKRCPQALVFLMTKMDIEMLVGSSAVDWTYVDGVISKERLDALWFRYHEHFCRVFGRSLWPLFVDAVRGCGKKSILYTLDNMRRLLASLRQWRMEPHILTAGQGAPELIDHAERHTSMVWELIDGFISSLCENSRPASGCLQPEDIMYLAMAAWLHDIGHRGDSYCSESIPIRTNHAAISDYLILRNPDAFHLDWLKDISKETGECDSSQRLECRNSTKCLKNAGGALCPQRLLGLLCRHHQSSAPLQKEALEKIQEKGKAISPYARLGKRRSRDASEEHLNIERGEFDSERDLREWMECDQPLHGWVDSKIMCLEDFFQDNRRFDRMSMMAGLLRLLDGIQVHRNRVGSSVCIESFNEFLNTKGMYADNLKRRYDRILNSSPPGTATYAEVLKERMKLDPYSRLVRIQYVHYWRQMAVHDVKSYWEWTKDGGNVCFEFLLDDAGLGALGRIKPDIAVEGVGKEDLELKSLLIQSVAQKCLEFRDVAVGIAEALEDGSKLKKLLKQDDVTSREIEREIEGENVFIWGIHVLEELIISEVSGQTFAKGSNPSDTQSNKIPLFTRCLPEGVGFRIYLAGSLSKPFKQPVALYQFPEKTEHGDSI